MVKVFLVAAVATLLLTQCSSSQNERVKSDSVQSDSLTSNLIPSDFSTVSTGELEEVEFNRYKDESENRIGDKPLEVWKAELKLGESMLLYRFNQYDVLIDIPSTEENVGYHIRVFRKSKSVKISNNHLIFHIPPKAEFNIPSDDKNEEQGLAYYFLGITKDYLFIDEGTDVQRSFHIYKLGSFKHIYSLGAYDIKLIGTHEIEFFQDTDLPADSINCNGHVTGEYVQKLYKESPQQFVVAEKVLVDLRTKKVRKTGEVECQYRQ